MAQCVIGYGRNQKSLDQALALGIVDQVTTDIAEAVGESDLVVLCTPLGAYAALCQEMAPHLSEATIITDVGSVKQQPTDHILDLLPSALHANIIPAHPIAGKETSGPAAAQADLYDEKVVILTPTSHTKEVVTVKLMQLWQAVGANVEIWNAKLHDQVFAAVSHLPQKLAFDYAALELESEDDAHLYSRFIRLGGSDPIMWKDIFAANDHNIARYQSLFIEHFTALFDAVSTGRQDVIEAIYQRNQDKIRYLHPASSPASPSNNGLAWCVGVSLLEYMFTGGLQRSGNRLAGYDVLRGYRSCGRSVFSQ